MATECVTEWEGQKCDDLDHVECADAGNDAPCSRGLNMRHGRQSSNRIDLRASRSAWVFEIAFYFVDNLPKGRKRHRHSSRDKNTKCTSKQHLRILKVDRYAAELPSSFDPFATDIRTVDRMGNTLKKMFDRVFGNKEMRVRDAESHLRMHCGIRQKSVTGRKE